MRRIDTSTAAQDLFGKGKHGWRNGNPQAGVRPTQFNAEFVNALQEEIANAIENAGINLNPEDNQQLFKAISSLAGGSGKIESVDALRQLKGEYPAVLLNAYYTGGTTGGGVFVADAQDKTTADNGGTVIVDTSGMRWKRVFKALSLYDFGYDKSKNNATSILNAVENAAIGVVVDCLGLSIDTGNQYPKNNKYANGQFVINGKAVDVQYQIIRSGLGRFISGSGAASNLKSNEWTGAGLVVIGEKAMGQVERCVSAIAIGDRSQGFSRISRDNISIGADSLINVQADTEWYDQSKMSGTRNIGIGGNAGRGITSGYSNIAIGRNSGQGLGTGFSNIALGSAALAGVGPIGLSGDIEVFWPSPTSRTVAVGESVLQMYQGRDAQTAIGGGAAKNTKVAGKVTALGANALENLERNLAPNGGDVLWSGTETGSYIQSGHNITLNFGNIRGAQVGYWVGIRLTSGDAATVQGDVVPVEVTAAAGNSLTIRSPKELNASGNAELKYVYSTSSAAAKNEELTVIGTNALKNAVSGAYTTVIGADAMLSSDNPQKTVAVGASALRSGAHVSSVAVGYWCAPTISSEQSVFIGDSCGYRNVQGDVLSGKITNSIAIGYGARLGGSNEIQLGMYGQTLYAPSAVNIRSDARDKADIEPLDFGLDFVRKLKPVTGVWDRRDAYTDELFTNLPPHERSEKLREWWANPSKDGRHKESLRQHWFIAQDVVALEEEYGKLPMINFRQDNYTIEYEMFVPVLVKALQEMADELESMKKQMQELKK